MISKAKGARPGEAETAAAIQAATSAALHTAAEIAAHQRSAAGFEALADSDDDEEEGEESLSVALATEAQLSLAARREAREHHIRNSSAKFGFDTGSGFVEDVQLNSAVEMKHWLRIDCDLAALLRRCPDTSPVIKGRGWVVTEEGGIRVVVKSINHRVREAALERTLLRKKREFLLAVEHASEVWVEPV